ncbi:MAG: WHG domain-containing protein [Nocardioides sp.]|uniref:TetR/AcrR family transcriptional regulator n=1 Tax=Nocardioides sp. TaxID=35761 RepID=UPI0039E2F5FD
MPAPDRTSLAEIVAAGRRLLETGGPSRVTMQAVAGEVGVRAPSLYKRVRDREALLDLILAATAEDLAGALEATDGTFPELARAYRAFAHDQPEGFRLMLASQSDPATIARTSAPVLDAAEALVGAGEALEAARLLTAWTAGFITMELAGAFRLGGDVDEAFEFGLATLAAALSR